MATGDILLRDFKPRAMVKVPVHEVERAAFPPSRSRTTSATRAAGIRRCLPRALARMDRVNVKRIVILTGGWGDALQGVVDRMVKPHPDRFTVFTQPDWSRIDEPGFGEAMAAQVRDSFARGARGLKVLKSLGLVVRDRTGRLVTVDDPRLDPMWAECGRLGIPVSIHTADPDAFFEPLDATNERWDELGEHPDWSFHGPKFPPKRALLDARNRVFARHPGDDVHRPARRQPPGGPRRRRVGARPVPERGRGDGARHAELGRQPRRARAFFLKYADRILFGTDAAPDEAMYRNWFRFLETADEALRLLELPRPGTVDDLRPRPAERRARAGLREERGARHSRERGSRGPPLRRAPYSQAKRPGAGSRAARAAAAATASASTPR